MTFPSITDLIAKGKSSFNRFPVTIIWAVLGTFFMMYAIEDSNGDPFKKYTPELFTLILGVSWFIGIQFFIEQQKHSKKWKWAKLGLAILLLLFYAYLSKPNSWVEDNPIYYIRFFLFFIAGHLFVLYSPFIKKWNTKAYWNFLKNIAISLLRSGFFTFILYLGLVLALAAIDALFDVYIKSKTYGQLFAFCIGIVNTWIYLTDFPTEIRKNTQINFQKPLEVFVKFILIPLVILYLIILYAYSFKIVLEWNLPKGWVSNLVIALSLLGFIVQVIINPVRTSIKSWTITKFQPWFYILLLPMIGLLFVSIYRRTADYGITENRYFVFLIAFWILGVTLYMLVAKEKRLIILPISLFVCAILSSFGFWGAISVSKRSQLHQFEKTFNTIMANGKTATHEQIKQLKSITTYFNNREAVNQLNGITQLNVKAVVNEEETYEEPGYVSYKWTNAQKLIDTLGITLDPESKITQKNTIYYSIYQRPLKSFLPIDSYNQFIPIPINYQYNNGFSNAVIDCYLNSNKMILEVSNKQTNKCISVIDLRPTITDVVAKDKHQSELKDKEVTIHSTYEGISSKFIISELQVETKNDTLLLNYVGGYLFLKKEATPK